MDGCHLKGIFDYLFAQQSRIGPHADNILIVVVVRYAVHIVGHCQRLAFGGRRCRGELAGLHSIIEPERTEIQERRQDVVDAVVKKIVQLSFGQHGHTYHGNLYLVFFERNVVAVKVPSVVDILTVGIDDRVVAGRIQLFFENSPCLPERFVDRAQNLRDAAQRIVGLYFMVAIERLGIAVTVSV